MIIDIICDQLINIHHVEPNIKKDKNMIGAVFGPYAVFITVKDDGISFEKFSILNTVSYDSHFIPLLIFKDVTSGLKAVGVI